MRNRYDDFVPEIENGDIVKLRNGAICIVINDMILNFNKKVWETTLNRGAYTKDYLDIDGASEFDIIKIKSCSDLYGTDYFNLQDECIVWDWVREERNDSVFTVAKEDVNSEKCITKEEIREIVKEVREIIKEGIIEVLKEFIEK